MLIISIMLNYIFDKILLRIKNKGLIANQPKRQVIYLLPVFCFIYSFNK